MPKVWITAEKLIKVLNITEQELLDIQDFFDSDPNDRWELRPDRDYRVINQTTGLRDYSDTGAYAIASYIAFKDKQRDKGFLSWFRQLLKQFKKDVRRAFIHQSILYNSSSLVRRSDRFFLNERDIVAIFATRRDFLRRMAAQAEPSLIVGQDYYHDIDKDIRYYSLSGILILSKEFSQSLVRRNRQEWCKQMGDEIQPTINTIVKKILNRGKEIEKAKKQARRRDKNTCLVTGLKPSVINSPNLASHHLYAAAHYPHLAGSVDNIITIAQNVHNHFHQSLGGKQKPCTVDDFINYVHEFHPQNLEVSTWLQQQKAKLPPPGPLSDDVPLVLFLPPSRVSSNNC
ncbi:hypothetical protein L3556_08050 [Candidatus Synechococcus calcipolaris G9]|uniref:Uncharacterized protein n=1 Tax=Candidatus Synechococcus calcipolaris G9 TaxID=1497997 RepID=A0ABT6EYU5_9SYNE|nr:hypothetical protein [Candidatus Synechococcus calcipolaris]MDG2990878.1 hypothetical protein [Candidatus Synechococcus calcipolaris G9]